MAVREAVVSFWLEHEGCTRDERTGAVLLYIDAKTKPLWTHHWTRATKVSDTGRVMPAVTTMTLHSGAGTPLVYRSWSGRVSLPVEATKFLDTYEEHAGEGTARRVVVMDREAHAVWLFKELADHGRLYIVPLRLDPPQIRAVAAVQAQAEHPQDVQSLRRRHAPVRLPVGPVGLLVARESADETLHVPRTAGRAHGGMTC
ncbi:MAG: hypothetical protein JRI25_27825 [Deltaproteobacteria bacterium]|nr:hypothetical protein [Deltaproteobacteria bacterium]